MIRTFSVYLDAVRFLAAITVVCCHFTFAQFTGGYFPYQDALSTEAVTVFFVLSGYVICYVANERELTLREFAVSRCARVYSVAIPAIVLTIAIDAALTVMGGGQNIPSYEYHGLWKYLPVFLTFTTEIGPLHAKVLTDGAFWSLSYEVWYYIVFALAFYLPRRARVVAVPLGIIALGIPALIYFPVWLLGCGVYYLHQKAPPPKWLARVIAGGSLTILIVFHVTGADETMDHAVDLFFGGTLNANLHNSMHFALHYLVGALVAVNFYAVRYCDLRWLSIPRIGNTIAYLASFTFAIYLGHRPLMDFWALVIGHNPHSAASVVLLFSLVLGSTFFFAFVSEHQKRRWRALFKWLFAGRIHQRNAPV